MRLRLTGGTSGFKTIRDLMLFGVGAFVDVYHILTTDPAHYALDILLFGAGLMGAPYVLKSDEKKRSE